MSRAEQSTGFVAVRLCDARPLAAPVTGAPCVLWPDHRGDHIDALNQRWSQEPAKPSPDLCDATASRDGSAYRCSMTKGHAGYHVELAANGVPNAVWPPEKIREEGPAKCGNVRRAAGFELRCTLASGHAGSHEAHDGGGFVDRWANAGDANGGDKVNHPTHYNTHPAGIEAIDVIEHLTFNVGTAIKYLWRAGLKAGAEHDEDLRKAIWYIERERARVAKKAGG